MEISKLAIHVRLIAAVIFQSQLGRCPRVASWQLSCAIYQFVSASVIYTEALYKTFLYATDQIMTSGLQLIILRALFRLPSLLGIGLRLAWYVSLKYKGLAVESQRPH